MTSFGMTSVLDRNRTAPFRTITGVVNVQPDTISTGILFELLY